jgi:hypothetical protein
MEYLTLFISSLALKNGVPYTFIRSLALKNAVPYTFIRSLALKNGVPYTFYKVPFIEKWSTLHFL